MQGFDGQSIAADPAQWVPPFACKLKEMLVTATAAQSLVRLQTACHRYALTRGTRC